MSECRCSDTRSISSGGQGRKRIRIKGQRIQQKMPIFTYAFHSKRRPTHATTTTDDEGYGNEQQLHILVEDYIRDEEKQEETYALLQTMVGLMTNGDNETKKGVARQLIEKGWYKQISKSQAP